jgi:hypothetical protein
VKSTAKETETEKQFPKEEDKARKNTNKFGGNEEKIKSNKERMRKTRANKTEEEKEQIREKDRARKKQAKIDKTAEELIVPKEKQKEAMKKARADKTKVETDQMKKNDNARKKQGKISKTAEELQLLKEKNKEAAKKARAGKTKEETDQMREDDRTRKKQDKEKRADESKCLARNVMKVLAGEQIVKEMSDTKTNLGPMNKVCSFCNARKWSKETPSQCCNAGKVVLDVFPDPPKIVQSLLTSETVEARHYRENIRCFNNALALSSLKVDERKFKNGYSPSVIFEGERFSDVWSSLSR